MKILNRDYDIPVCQIKGFEKLDSAQTEDIDHCKLTRYIVVLDETRYTINKDGDPEMTQAAQEEYDDFVSKIREEMTRGEIRIMDEGYGIDEDELEWHITGCVINAKENDCIAGIIEIDTCVRTDDPVD